ncbi:hypothetical protein F0562_016962 [Nyssa sinensis]|uniref:peroxidase n=1 Tax=Nyssa sinensis TaxID=561372 RepID=A0A5J4ZFU1_9ASTE|nr:hypothetical protein F0562_016962 [Nyssa sinensis]
MVKSCDASLLLETANGIESEKISQRSFGMRNFKYLNTIKEALETECPMTVSCADIVALSARDGVFMFYHRFQSIGVDVEGTVALLGAHSVGRVHCTNLVGRLYPTVDSTLNP